MLEKSADGVLFVFDPSGRAFEAVYLAGSFNNWNVGPDRLTLGNDGRWRLRRVLPPGRHEYKYVADGQWLSDPAADGQIRNQHGSENSLVEVREPPAPQPAVGQPVMPEAKAELAAVPTSARTGPESPPELAPQPAWPRVQYTGFTRARQQRIYLKKVDPAVTGRAATPAVETPAPPAAAAPTQAPSSSS